MASLGYATGKSIVSIILNSGSHLVPKDRNGLSDPYVVMTYPGSQLKTGVVKKNVNPVWGYQFQAEVEQISTFKVHFEVWDKGKISKKYMGETELMIPSDMTNMEPRTLQLALTAQGKHAKELVSGHLEVIVSVKFSTADMAASVVKESGVEKNLAAAFAAVPQPSVPTPSSTATTPPPPEISHSVPSIGDAPRFGSIALDSRDQIVIADDLSGTVKIGTMKILEFPCKAALPHIALDSQDNSEAVVPMKKFDSKGSLVREIGEPTHGSDGLHKVRDICLDDIHNLFLVVSWNGLHFYSAEGALLRTIKNNRNAAAEKFLSLQSVCVNSKGQIILLDSVFMESNKIMIYDSGGNFVSESGKRGKDSGDFNHPRGMAVDAHDRIYILDSWNNQDRIQVFDPAGGHLISCFIGPSDPCCLDITVSKKSGQIYLLGRSMKILSPFCM